MESRDQSGDNFIATNRRAGQRSRDLGEKKQGGSQDAQFSIYSLTYLDTLYYSTNEYIKYEPVNQHLQEMKGLHFIRTTCNDLG